MANEVKQIETNGTYPDVPNILASIDNSFAEAVIVSNENDRTNGNVFVWKNTGTVNDGTVYAGNSGFWEMQHDVSYVDVKWFGAKGDYINSGSPGNDDTQAIQNALNYATANYLDVYISKGKYRITPPNAGGTNPQTATSSLVLGTTSNINSIKIFGAGPESSSLVYDEVYNGNPVLFNNVLRVESITNVIITIENFEIRGQHFVSPTPPNLWYGCGLYLFNSLPLNVKNMSIFGLNEGIRLDQVNNAKFEDCFIQYVNKGVIGETFNPGTPSNNTLPNILNFLSCQFIAIDVLAAEFIRAHNINFQSCDLSYGGKKNTPSLTQVAAIDCSFDGTNGANGLNVKDCYFEGNIGLADIRVQVQTNTPVAGQPNPFYGTHTFQGNTFNRNVNKNVDNEPVYTNHNILITGSGQTPKRLFSQSKCKLVFIGNGFFVNVPGSSNNYVPDPSRRPIEIEQYSDGMGVNYWEFDIVEQGNTYNGDAVYHDAPIFGLQEPQPGERYYKMPQVSEYTRVKAFGAFFLPDELNPEPLPASYNVESIKELSPGHFQVRFANELKRMPVITITCNNGMGDNTLAYMCVAAIDLQNTQGFTFRILNLTGGGSGEIQSCCFNFIVF